MFLFMLMVFAPSNTYFPTLAFPSLVLGLSISLSLCLSFSNVFVDPQKLLDFIFETKNDLILPLRYFICIHSHQLRFHKVMHKTSSSDALIARWVSLLCENLFKNGDLPFRILLFESTSWNLSCIATNQSIATIYRMSGWCFVFVSL